VDGIISNAPNGNAASWTVDGIFIGFRGFVNFPENVTI